MAGENKIEKMAAFLLPDGVHHFRRMWSLVELIYPTLLGENTSQFEKLEMVRKKISAWETNEHPVILSFDGLQHIKDINQ